MSLIGPFNKQDLIKTLDQTYQEVRDTIADLPLDDLYDRSKNTWSPSDILKHLIKINKPLASSLNLPRFIIALKWGKSERPSRQYHEVRKFYQASLARGAKSGEYAPEFVEIPGAQDDAERMRVQVLQSWDKVNKKLLIVLERWPEMYFDKYLLPHHSLGKITVREMIMYTIYHNMHHISKVQKWFENSLREKQIKDEEEF